MTDDVAAALACGLGWLLGTIPWSWLLVRWTTGRDLAAEGSGNVGALNSLRVSRSKALGVAALALDLAKGLASVLAACALGAGEEAQHLAGLLCVFGHTLNPWLSLLRRRISGGKGFAAAAGVLLLLAPWMVAVWVGVLVVAYVVFRGLRGVRDEAPASLLATLLLAPAAHVLYGPPTTWTVVGMALLMSTRLVPEVVALLLPRPRA